MRVGDIKPTATSVAKRLPAAGTASGFASFIEAPTGPGVSAVHSVAPVSALGAMIALQQVEDATARRSRGVKRAETMLSELDELQRGLILGELPTARLQAMAGQMKQRMDTLEDPLLHALLADVELRLAVELAKRGISTSLSAPVH